MLDWSLKSAGRAGGRQEGGGGGWKETKFMAQNVTLTRNVTTSEAICKIKS